MKMPSLIFVHGAWHSPEYWSKVIPAFKQQGYRCFAPQLDFCGTAQPVDSLASSVNQIQTLIAEETILGNDVVLINHSFGGSAGCTSVKGFTQKDPSRLTPNSGKVIGIIQLCAFMPRSDLSLYDMVDITRVFHHSGPDGWEIIDQDPEALFYNDLPPEDVQFWKSRLLKHSSATFKDAVNVYPGWADVPVSYIFCKKDGAIPLQIQEAMVEGAKEAGASITTKSLDTGHSPFLSKTEETIGAIVESLNTLQGQ
jgi:pimeloyl-ACP methyl ester carboxylesterase